MSGLKNIDRWVTKKFETLNKKITTKISKSAYTFIERLTYKTPVDTSMALSNWQVSIGVPISGYIDAHQVGSRGSSASHSRAVTVSLAEGKIFARKPDSTIIMVNNTPYIGDLNDGKSMQAQKGFIDDQIRVLFLQLSSLKG